MRTKGRLNETDFERMREGLFIYCLSDFNAIPFPFVARQHVLFLTPAIKTRVEEETNF